MALQRLVLRTASQRFVCCSSLLCDIRCRSSGDALLASLKPAATPSLSNSSSTWLSKRWLAEEAVKSETKEKTAPPPKSALETEPLTEANITSNPKIQALVDQIVSLDLLEVSILVQALQEKLGVTNDMISTGITSLASFVASLAVSFQCCFT